MIVQNKSIRVPIWHFSHSRAESGLISQSERLEHMSLPALEMFQSRINTGS